MSLLELSNKSDIPYSSLHGILSGKSNPTLSTLILLCNALEVSISQMIGDQELFTNTEYVKAKQIPLLSWSEVLSYVKKTFTSSDNQLFIHSCKDLSGIAFALPAKSLLPHLTNHDSILIFDAIPEKIGELDNKYVLLSDNNKVKLKLLHYDADKIFVHSPEDTLPARTITENEKVIAYLVEINTPII